jgi:hypothetical protein
MAAGTRTLREGVSPQHVRFVYSDEPVERPWLGWSRSRRDSRSAMR